MNVPKISIVVPVYNVQKFLRQCLDSAVNQTLKEIEIICVDDGSTDSCGRILDEYAEKDDRFVIIHKENGGYGKAMNTGLDIARGEYFCILESDDFFMADTCETLYKIAKEFDADVVRSDYFDYTTKNNKINLVAKQMANDYSYYYRLICPNKEREVYSFVMHNWTGIYKMSFLNDKKIRYNETPGASYQDNGFFFQVFSQTERLVYIPRPFYCYRIDNPGSSIHNKSKVYTMSEEYSYIRKFLSSHPEFEYDVLPAYYARLFRAHHQTYLRISNEFKKEYAEFFRDDMLKAIEEHLLDTGLMTEKERFNLMALLSSVKEYELINSKDKKKKAIYNAKRIIKTEGWKPFFKEIKKQLGVQ